MQKFCFNQQCMHWLLLTCLLTLFAVPTMHAASPMCVTRTTADGLGHNLVSGVFASGSSVYAATYNGLGISRDNGATFANTLFPTSNILRSVYATGSWVYATPLNGTMWASADNGVRFDAVGLDGQLAEVSATPTTVYVGTSSGLAISADEAHSWSFRTTVNGLGADQAYDAVVDGSTVYVATQAGLAVSTNNGLSFANRTTAHGLGSNNVYDVTVNNGILYAATSNGVAISDDGGATFVNRTMADGLGNNTVWDVYANDTTIYASTNGGGLAISTDGGASFTTITTADGLGSNTVYNVSIGHSNLYVATLNGLSVCTLASTIADLISLMISSGLLEPPFAPSITKYSTTVANSLASITITPVAADPGATIHLNGVPIASGSTSNTIPLNVGQNGITIVVTAPDHVTTRTYTLVVQRAIPPMCFNRTTADGLVFNRVRRVFARGSTVYAGTDNGLSISRDGGTTFTNTLFPTSSSIRGIHANSDWLYVSTQSNLWKSADNGLSFVDTGLTGSLINVYATPSLIYVSKIDGLAISSDGGQAWIVRTVANGLGHNMILDAVVDGATLYVATFGGLSISTDNGLSFVNRTTANGLGSNHIQDVVVNNGILYAATNNGLSISTDGGATFVNRTIADGLGTNGLLDVYANDTTIYASTNGGGLSISSDGGASFVTKTIADGLGRNTISGASIGGSNLYVSTINGLAVCPLASTNADLSHLTSSSGLAPAFEPSTTHYTASVANSVTSTIVTPIAADTNATITVNGVSVASGSASNAIPLSVGQNSIIIVVTAQNQTSKTYTLLCIRAQVPDWTIHLPLVVR